MWLRNYSLLVGSSTKGMDPSCTPSSSSPKTTYAFDLLLRCDRRDYQTDYATSSKAYTKNEHKNAAFFVRTYAYNIILVGHDFDDQWQRLSTLVIPEYSQPQRTERHRRCVDQYSRHSITSTRTVSYQASSCRDCCCCVYGRRLSKVNIASKQGEKEVCWNSFVAEALGVSDGPMDCLIGLGLDLDRSKSFLIYQPPDDG